MTVRHDLADHYYLDTPHVMKNGQPLFFGAVKVGKRYVSFHLMPVYVNPALLDAASSALKARMQGKSCFNFTKAAPDLFAELAELTRRGRENYAAQGYL